MKQFFALLLVLFTPILGIAEDTPKSQESESSFIGSARNTISSGLFGLTDYIDALFDDIRSQEQRQDDWFRFTTELRFRAGTPFRFRERVRAKFNLRAISDRLSVVVDLRQGDRVDRNKVEEDVSEGQDLIRSTSGDGGNAGLRYALYREKDTKLYAEAGLRFDSGVYPIFRIRGVHWMQFSEMWSSEVSQSVYWDGDSGYGERTRLDFNRLLDDTSFLRLRGEYVFSEESRGIDLLEEFTYTQFLTDKIIVSPGISVFAYTRPAWSADNYRVFVRYRTPLYQHWLMGEVEPAIEFPEERDYKMSPAIYFKLDILIDRETTIGSGADRAFSK